MQFVYESKYKELLRMKIKQRLNGSGWILFKSKKKIFNINKRMHGE